MKKIDLFDTFENAEDELMEDFTDMSPNINDEQFERLLAVSERNYKMKKKEIERARKDNNINYDEESVSGVDRVKRPVWLTPLLTAASLVLVTGAVIGSVLLFNRNGSLSDGGGITAAVTAVTTDKMSTETTTVKAAVTTAARKTQPAKTTVKTTKKPVTTSSNAAAMQTQTTEKTTAKPQTTTTAAPKTDSGRLDEAAAAEGTAFKRGVSNGNVYTSEFAGFKFTAPTGTSFLNEDDLYTHYVMPTRFMTEEERNVYFTSIDDAVVTYANAEGGMDVSFINTKLRYSDTPNISEESYLNDYIENGLTDTVYSYVSGPDLVTLGGKDYYMIRIEDDGYFQNIYVRRIDENFIIKISASGSAIADENDFAKRFEAV